MGLELDEYIYSKVLQILKKTKKVDQTVLVRAIYLDNIKPQLTIFARAVTGRPIEIFPAEREGGYKNDSFFLPVFFSHLDTSEENKAFYYYRILYLSVQQQLRLNWQDDAEYSTEDSRQKAKGTSKVILEHLFAEFPLVQEIFSNAKDYFLAKKSQKNIPDLTWLYGKWMNDDQENKKQELENVSDRIKTTQIEKPSTTLKAKAVEAIRTHTADKKQQEDYVFTHNFEKVETADEFNGRWKDFDGEDELKDHEEALEELNMKYTVRVDEEVHSVYQADFIENATLSESADAEEIGIHIKYDEWDYKKAKYRPGFCKLYPKKQIKANSNYYSRTISKNAATLMGLRKMLTSVNNKLQQQRRQTRGDEFDIDAITDLFVDIKSRHYPSENIYIANRKLEKDLSIILLLDISLSSDSYVSNRRVLDVEKEVSILFGEILNEFNVDFSIDSFYSKTRNYASYLTIKDFNEKWDTAKYKIGAVEPQGYTRIGTALRHAGTRLDEVNNRNKWVILISDGKPNDYDRYEGKHGINDVKQALRELNQRQINSYALAIEAQAKYYLPQMFGQNHYEILTTPTGLLHALVKLFEKIKHQQ